MENTGASAATTRVLLVDDDVKLCELLQESLRREGMESKAIHDGGRGLEAAQSGAYAIVVLDVMLPGLGGFEVLRRLRASGGEAARLPVLMLTARGDELDKVLGLELGADDYLPKPFSARELAARLRAILRRTEAHSEVSASSAARKIVRVADLELDGASREVTRGGARVELTGAEFDMLDALLRAAGEIVTREAISQTALGRALMPYDRSIDVHISNLRRKIGPDAAGRERIKSVRGVGYIYVKPSDN
ncbi:MAG TPA: response regulator transcription factor [Abditibacterium sp.]|jgi:two-component system response regulator CpxR